MSKFKIGVYGLVASLMVAFGAFGLGSANTPTTSADITGAFVIGPLTSTTAASVDIDAFRAANPINCTDGPNETAASGLTFVRNANTSSAPTTNGLWICIQLDREQGNDGTDSADVTFDSDDVGRFTTAICANQDNTVPVAGAFFQSTDVCKSVEGLNTDQLIVDCTQQLQTTNTPQCSDTGDESGSVSSNPNYDVDTTQDAFGGILVFWACPVGPASTTIRITASDAEGGVSTVSFSVQCRGQAGGITLTASPTTVEIVPAPSNTAHSLIQLTVTDSAGAPILIPSSTDVDFLTDRCAIETSGVDDATELAAARTNIAALSTAIPGSYTTWDTFANGAPPDTVSPQSDNTSVFDITIVTPRSMAAAILHCDPHAGITTATPGVATVTACIEVPDAADICRTVTVTVIGPPASITVAASPTSLRCGEKSTITVTVKDAIGQNVSDHTLVEMVTNLGGTLGGTGGVLSFVGPVVPVSSNGAGTFGGVATAFLLTSESHSGPYEVVATTGGTLPGGGAIGIFSTPPISAQVTVTCTIPAPTAAPAPTVTAPRTGTGITPPSTGDAGLSSSSSSWTLFAIGGLAAFALAGLATLRFARR